MRIPPSMNFRNYIFSFAAVIVLVALCSLPLLAQQSSSAIQGTVTDSAGAVVPNAKVTVRNTGTGLERVVQTDSAGDYSVPSLPPGTYSVSVEASGLQKQVIQKIDLDVARTVPINAQLKVGSTSEVVTVTGEAPVIESTTQTVSQVINQRTVQEIPLNGRHFVDLGLLIPGTVTPPANGFLTAPLRGQGSFAINTAGSREDAINFLINGVNLQDPVQNQITFQPSINTVSEFKVDNSTYSAESGRSSGAIVNVATRSGTNDFHGEAFEFIRNNDLDARNYFNPVGQPQGPFKRNQFGGNIGGPIFKNKTFFFGSYEGLRQRQGLTINSGVLTAAQRTQATTVGNPAVLKLLPLIPVANDPTGARFLGAATAPVNIDQGTGDVSHTFSDKDRLHAYYAWQRDQRGEPVLQGNTVTGFGDIRQSHRQLFTFSESHVFSPTLVNEARLGFNRIHIVFSPVNNLDPNSVNINDGNTGAIGIPQINISDIRLNFGGPAGFPQGRGDTTAVLSDTLSHQRGRHSFKYGGEFRRSSNNAFNGDTGTANFNNTVVGGVTTSTATNNFINGNVSQFIITPGSRPSRVYQSAIGVFTQDSWKLRPYFTLELGLRYEWNGTPVEAQNRQNNKNFQPRVGFAWDLFHNGKTILRSGYGLQTDQPVMNLVTALASNPPFAVPVNVANVPLVAPNPAGVTPASISAAMVDPNFKNAYNQSWNLNLQEQISPSIGMMVGYFGSKGTHLRVPINLNQPLVPAGAIRPFQTVVSVAGSPTLNGKTLTTIADQTSTSNSSYNALWVTANKRFSHGIQFNASYTWSKSLDDNSLSSQGLGSGGTGTSLQDFTNVHGDWGPSDYDARNRFVLSGIYDLPWNKNRLVGGWQLGTIFQVQSGNPITVVNSSTTINGVGNSVRPDIIGPISTGLTVVAPNVIQYIQQPACTVVTAGCSFLIVNRFGNERRNSVLGPGFQNLDFSLIKRTKITERLSNEFRVEAFDLLNHPNFGNPNRVMSTGATATFGQITNTRNPTGDAGSSRQLQFAMKFIF